MTALRKVLVVDDDPVVGRSFDRVLGSKGYAVITASDGAEALARIAAEDYDVVYTDIRMPGMDGIAVAENIKGNRPWLPVVIVSGYATADNEARAKAAGVSAVLHKPLSPQMIEDSVREAVLERDQAAAAKLAVEPAPVAAPEATVAPEAVAAPVEAARARRLGPLATLGMLVAAPFIGLAYTIVLPFAGLLALIGTAVWRSTKGFVGRVRNFSTFSKNVGLFVAAPFIGLVYALALPFVGLGMIVWVGAKAVLKRA